MIGFIIPTKNEPDITTLIKGIRRVMEAVGEDYSITLVDCSTDDTAELAKRAGASVIRQRSRGLGGAIKEGLLSVDAEVAFTMDADMSHDPEHIPTFLAKLREGYDVVVGSRKMEGGKALNWGLRRRLISDGANLLGRLVAGVDVSDLTSGYRAYRVSALRSLGLERIRATGFAFQLEVLFHMLRSGFKAASIPIIFRDRVKGRSKLSLREVREFAATALRLGFSRLIPRSRPPWRPRTPSSDRS
ncbi:MAG: glycosyltransferase [Candidatus Bathyarchaeia archaeon]